MSVSIASHRLGDRSTPLSRIRLMRMQRHLATAGLACVLWVMSGPSVASLGGFLTLAVVVGVMLSSLARATDAFLGYWWGWLYGEPVRSTALDRFVNRIIHRVGTILTDHLAVQDASVDVDSNDPRVRIVPIEPDQL